MTLQTRQEANIFKYRGVSLRNHDSAFKISTDSLLLADWADVSESQNILDVGCGTGVIGLLLASRNANVDVTLIEKDHLSYLEACANAINSESWNRTSVLFGEFKMLHGLDGAFDHIVCNPPYFEQAQLGPSQRKNDTRHSQSLPSEELFNISYRISTPDAKLSLIYPYQQKNQLIYLKPTRWIMNRECEVIGKSGRPALIMWEFQKDRVSLKRTILDLRQKKSSNKSV